MGSLRDVISSKTGNAPGSVDDDHDVNDVFSVAHAEPHLQQDVAGALLQALTTHPLEVSQHRLEEILAESSTATVTASDSTAVVGPAWSWQSVGLYRTGLERHRHCRRRMLHLMRTQARTARQHSRTQVSRVT